MSEYVVEGRYRTRDGPQSFSRTVEAPNPDVARERVYALFGSEHGLDRARVEIAEVAE